MSNGPDDRTVLIAGATGYIGRKLVDALHSQGKAICVLTRDTSRLSGKWLHDGVTGRSGDIGRAETLMDACSGMHAVFHLASHAEDEAADSHWRVTVEGTRHLLEASARSGVKKFIYVSSVKAMGEGGESCLDESSHAEPVTSYGRAKLEAERLVLEAGRQHGMHVCNLRLPLVYGRDNRGNIWRMIAAVDRGRFPPLPETGNRRSMVHVDDVVQALQLAMGDPDACGQTYIVTDGQTYSTRQIYLSIHEALGRAIPRWTIPVVALRATARLGDVIGGIRGRSFVFDSTVLGKLTGSAWYSCRKIEAELGYRPTRTLTDGLREMVNQYKKPQQA
jgi:UDP-glucose 4-epimerase